MTRTIWLSFDLGVNGDYEGMYTWLDAHDAKECGDSFAFLKYEFEHSLVEELREELSRAVSLSPKARIYVILTTEGGKTRGRFIVGNRRNAPWSGFAPKPNTEDIS